MISDLTQPNGEVKRVEVVSQFPSESGHWYDPKSGQQVELPPRSRATTAIKRGLVPGVTSITRQVAKQGLERWKINRAIDITHNFLADWEGDEFWPFDIETVQKEVWAELDAESEAITGRGKELHAAIESFAGANADYHFNKWQKHVDAVDMALDALGIDLWKGSSEHSFATERYGGKIDWHNDTWLLDVKSKDELYKDGKLKKLPYFENCMQLAAYRAGLNSPSLRIANVFVGVNDAAVHIHEWTPDEADRALKSFTHLVDYWWSTKN
jgi:hypothetical protein